MAGKILLNVERLALREGGFDAASSPIDCDEASNCIKKMDSEAGQGFNDYSLEELREKLSSLLDLKERRQEKDFEVTILSFPSAPDDDVSEYNYRSRENEPAEELDSVLIDAFDFTESEEEDDSHCPEDFTNNIQKDSSDLSYSFSIPAASSTPSSSSHFSLLLSSPTPTSSSLSSSSSSPSLAAEKVSEIQTIEALNSTSCCATPLLPLLPQDFSLNFCQDPLDDVLYHTLSSEVLNSSSSGKILNCAENHEDYGLTVECQAGSEALSCMGFDYVSSNSCLGDQSDFDGCNGLSNGEEILVDTDTPKQALYVFAVISEIGIKDPKDCSFTFAGNHLVSSTTEIRYYQDLNRDDEMSCGVGGVLPEVDDPAHWLKGKRNAVIDNAYMDEDSRIETLGSPVGELKEHDHYACHNAVSAVKDVSRTTEDAVSLTEAAVQTECCVIDPLPMLNLDIGAVLSVALDGATQTDDKNDGGSAVDATWMVSSLESVEGGSTFLQEEKVSIESMDAFLAEERNNEHVNVLPSGVLNLHALAIFRADQAMADMVNYGSGLSTHNMQHNTTLRALPVPLITQEYIDAEIMRALPYFSLDSHGGYRNPKKKLAADKEMERITRIMLQKTQR